MMHVDLQNQMSGKRKMMFLSEERILTHKKMRVELEKPPPIQQSPNSTQLRFTNGCRSFKANSIYREHSIFSPQITDESCATSSSSYYRGNAPFGLNFNNNINGYSSNGISYQHGQIKPFRWPPFLPQLQAIPQQSFALPKPVMNSPRSPPALLPPPPPRPQPPSTITTTPTTTKAAAAKASSKLDRIQNSWNIPVSCKIFKEVAEPAMNTIYQPKKEIEKPSESNHRIEEGLDRLKHVSNENSSIKSKFAKWFSFDSSPTPKPSLIRKFFSWFRKDDHDISDEAHVEIPKVEEEKALPLLPTWTEEMDREIDDYLDSRQSGNTLLVTAFAINIHIKDIRTLNGRSWLNDAVMEFYFNLIQERSTKNDKYPKVYTFGTFFYTRLEKGQPIGRWAKKLDFFSYDLLIVPIIYSSHWRLVVVRNTEKRIEYYDSLGNPFPACVNAIVKFLQTESREKLKKELDMSQWEIIHLVRDIPLQNNSYDCGVFACKYAEYITRGVPITFSQKDIPFFRRCMMYEIIHRELLIH